MDDKKLDLDVVEENAKQAEDQAQEEQVDREGQEGQEGKKKEKYTGVYTHTFDKPFTVGDMEVTELTFDFTALTGADHNACCQDALNRGLTVVVREYTPPYLTGMAARACTLRDRKGGRVLKYSDLERMRLTDMTKIQDEARLFLRRSGS